MDLDRLLGRASVVGMGAAACLWCVGHLWTDHAFDEYNLPSFAMFALSAAIHRRASRVTYRIVPVAGDDR